MCYSGSRGWLRVDGQQAHQFTRTYISDALLIESHLRMHAVCTIACSVNVTCVLWYVTKILVSTPIRTRMNVHWYSLITRFEHPYVDPFAK